MWLLVLAPAIVLTLLGAIAGIDATTGAIIALMFVGALPAGAALMSQIFIDAASYVEAAPPPISPHAAGAQRRV